MQRFKNWLSNILMKFFGEDVRSRVQHEKREEARKQNEALAKGFCELYDRYEELYSEDKTPRTETREFLKSQLITYKAHLRYQIAYTIHLMKVVQPFSDESMYFDALDSKTQDALLKQAEAILNDETIRNRAISNGVLPISKRQSDKKEIYRDGEVVKTIEPKNEEKTEVDN